MEKKMRDHFPFSVFHFPLRFSVHGDEAHGWPYGVSLPSEFSLCVCVSFCRNSSLPPFDFAYQEFVILVGFEKPSNYMPSHTRTSTFGNPRVTRLRRPARWFPQLLPPDRGLCDAPGTSVQSSAKWKGK